jgi:hypothetical protein
MKLLWREPRPAPPKVSGGAKHAGPDLSSGGLRQLNCSADTQSEVEMMMVAAGLGVLVVICLLLAMMETPPHIGR